MEKCHLGRVSPTIPIFLETEAFSGFDDQDVISTVVAVSDFDLRKERCVAFFIVVGSVPNDTKLITTT